MYLCGHAFDEEQKARNFAYYEALTVRDSSLSAQCQAVVAAEVGHLDLAYDYLGEAALMDLDNLEHNTRDGLHLAALAGTWMSLVVGFGGLRLHEATLSFTPRLPQRLTRIAFRLLFQGRRLRVEITPAGAVYTLAEGEPLTLRHDGEELTLTMAEPLTRELPPAPKYAEPTQPRGRRPATRRSGN